MCRRPSDTSRTPKDTIVVGLESPVRSFDPRYASDANSQYLENLLHCSLMSFDPDGAVIPELASQVPKWLDPKRLAVTLRDGIAFSDGQPVTADDVKATYEFFLDPNTTQPSPRAGAFTKVTKIEALDAKHVVFHLKEADASFLTNLVVGILPAQLAKTPSVLMQATGCGAFILESAHADRLLLKANPGFKLREAPRVTHLEFKIIEDERARFAKLRRGEIDLVQNNLTQETLKDINTKYPALTFQKRAAIKTAYIGFNMRNPIAANPALRRAIAYAIDRRQIIDYVLGGLATPATTMLTPGNPFLNFGLTQQTYDVQLAKKVLDEAGFKEQPDKPRLILSYKTTTDVTRINVAKAIASQLQKIGIQLNIEALEWETLREDIENNRMQLWGSTWIGFKDPDIYRHAFASTSTPPHGGNRGWYSNQLLDALLEEGRTLQDVQKRQEVYAKAQDIIARERPYIFLWHEENFAVFHQSLKDFAIYADGRLTSLTQAHK